MVPVTAWSCDAEQSDKQSQDWAAEVWDPRGTAGPPSRAAEGCAGWQSILQPNLVPADNWGDIRELFV